MLVSDHKSYPYHWYRDCRKIERRRGGGPVYSFGNKSHLLVKWQFLNLQICMSGVNATQDSRSMAMIGIQHSPLYSYLWTVIGYVSALPCRRDMYVYKKEAVAAKILRPETRRGVEDTLSRFCHFGEGKRLPGFVNGKEKKKEKVEPCGRWLRLMLEFRTSRFKRGTWILVV